MTDETTEGMWNGIWAVVELFGHVRIAGRITEVEHFGGKMARLDVPDGDGFVTEFFGHSAVFRIRPVTEDVARAVADANKPEPIRSWEMKPRQLHPPDGYHEAYLEASDEDDSCDDPF